MSTDPRWTVRAAVLPEYCELWDTKAGRLAALFEAQYRWAAAACAWLLNSFGTGYGQIGLN